MVGGGGQAFYLASRVSEHPEDSQIFLEIHENPPRPNYVGEQASGRTTFQFLVKRLWEGEGRGGGGRGRGVNLCCGLMFHPGRN